MIKIENNKFIMQINIFYLPKQQYRYSIFDHVEVHNQLIATDAPTSHRHTRIRTEQSTVTLNYYVFLTMSRFTWNSSTMTQKYDEFCSWRISDEYSLQRN